MTKKAATLLLAVSLAVSVCAMPVFAAGVTTGDYVTPSTTGENSSTGVTNVKYVVESSYTWSIPAQIDFGKNAGVVDANNGNTRKVNATLANNDSTGPAAAGTDDGTATKICILNNVIDVDKTLTISVSSSNAYYDSTKNSFFITTADSASAVDGQKLYYTVKTSDTGAGELNITTNTTVVSAASGTVSADKGLIFELNTKNGATAEKAGTYTGTLSFTATVATTT